MDIKTTHFGHSAVNLKINNVNFLIDPFINSNPLCPEHIKSNLSCFSDIDYIVLSHGHSDHVADALEISKISGCKLIATFELINLLIKDGLAQNQAVYMNKGGEIKIENSNLSLKLTNALHSSSYDSKDGNTYYAGEPCGILIKDSNANNSIYHAGDTSLFSDMSLIQNDTQIILSYLPIGDCFTMGPKDAAFAAKILQTKNIIPIHYKTFPPLTGTPEELKQELNNLDLQINVLTPDFGTEIKILNHFL